LKECPEFQTFVIGSGARAGWALDFETPNRFRVTQPRHGVDLPSTANWRIVDYGYYSLIHPADVPYKDMMLDVDLTTLQLKLTSALGPIPETAKWNINSAFAATTGATTLSMTAPGSEGWSVVVDQAAPQQKIGTNSNGPGIWTFVDALILKAPTAPIPPSVTPVDAGTVWHRERPRSWVDVP